MKIPINGNLIVIIYNNLYNLYKNSYNITVHLTIQNSTSIYNQNFNKKR